MFVLWSVSIWKRRKISKNKSKDYPISKSYSSNLKNYLKFINCDKSLVRFFMWLKYFCARFIFLGAFSDNAKKWKVKTYYLQSWNFVFFLSVFVFKCRRIYIHLELFLILHSYSMPLCFHKSFFNYLIILLLFYKRRWKASISNNYMWQSTTHYGQIS